MAVREQRREFADPGFIRFLFGNKQMAWVWLVVRVYLGWQWLSAGWEKLHSPGWDKHRREPAGVLAASVRGPGRRNQGHRALRLVSPVPGLHAPAPLVRLVRQAGRVRRNRDRHSSDPGAFVGVVAFFGAFMNFNFMLAGSASTNPVLFTLAILLLLAWKIAGYYGLDYVLLPAVGVPWQNRGLFGRAREEAHRHTPHAAAPGSA